MAGSITSGPVPTPGNTRRRQATYAKTQLPEEGYQGEIPEFPLDRPNQRELARWERVWRSPMAVMWSRMHVDLVVARYVRVCILVENDDHMSMALGSLHSEVRQLEDRLGLSPMALTRLGWEIRPDDVANQREEKRSTRRLKAVDPKLAKEG